MTRKIQEEELKMAQPWVGIRDEMVSSGFECLGTLHMAAQEGYYTPRACAKMGQPVQDGEIPTHCAIMANCYTELCMVDAEGNRVRPCLPVFRRRAAEAPASQNATVCVDRICSRVDRATKEVLPNE